MPTGKKEVDAKIFKKIEERYKHEPEILAKYYKELKAEGKSVRTIKNYMYDIVFFMNYLDAQPRELFYEKVDRDVINEFMLDLEERGVSDNRKLAVWYALQSFFYFLYDRELISKMPLPAKGKPKNRGTPKIKAMSEDEVAKLIEYIQNNGNPENIQRDLCWLALGCTIGLRISAILQINIEDIDFKKKKIRVVEKRDKVMDKDISDSVCGIIKNYIAYRNKRFPVISTGALFLGPSANRLCYETVRLALKDYSINAIGRSVAPHTMRRTCATILLKKFNDVYTVSVQLGHSNMQTTQRYIEVSDERMKTVATALGEIFK